jgi:hypothetical protein
LVVENDLNEIVDQIRRQPALQLHANYKERQTEPGTKKGQGEQRTYNQQSPSLFPTTRPTRFSNPELVIHQRSWEIRKETRRRRSEKGQKRAEKHQLIRERRERREANSYDTNFCRLEGGSDPDSAFFSSLLS